LDPVAPLLDTLRFGDDTERLRARWRAADQRGLARLFAGEECELWLHRRLKALDLVDALAPAHAEILARRARGLAAHALLVDAQTSATVETLNALAVPHVLLKGAALRLLRDSIPYGDARGIADIDVLVPAELTRPTWDAFMQRGFRTAYDPSLLPRDHYHMLSIVDEAGVVIEIHSSTSKDIPPDVAWRRQFERGVDILTPAGRTRVPAPTEMFWFALTHALRHGVSQFGLRRLLDLASIWASGAAIEWTELRDRLEGDELEDREAARLWLGEAAWLAGRGGEQPFGPLPHGHLARLLRWRLAIARWELGTRVTEKLLEEGVRSAFGLGVAPLVERAHPLVKARRRIASIGARGSYLLWQAVAG